MKFKLRKNKKYKRINSILYEDFDKILKFTQSFPVDIPEMDKYSIKYHERYIGDNLDKIEWILDEDKAKEIFFVEDEVFKTGKRGRPKKI